MSPAREHPLGLGPFLRALETRLAALPIASIRAGVLSFAEQLPAAERAALLAHFEPTSETGGGHGGDAPGNVPPGEGAHLLGDIDRFLASLGDKDDVEGWGWDQDMDEEWAITCESWRPEMEDLFEQASAAFVAGDLTLAAAALGALLHGLLLDGEFGADAASSPAAERLSTDLAEAKARYLAALYQTTPRTRRSVRLRGELSALRCIGGDISLQVILDTVPVPPRDLDAFLPSWVEELRRTPADERFDAKARQLLSEAVRLQRGVDGLEVLALELGAEHPEHLEEWIAALVQDGRRAAACEAARQALELLPPRGHARGRIYDALAWLRSESKDPSGAVEGRRQAWRASPSRDRLLALVAAARVWGEEEEIVDAEAALVERGLRAPEPSDRFLGSPRQACELLMLAGQVDPAVEELQGQGPLGWSSPNHPGAVVVPYLIVAGSVAAVPPEDLLLSDVFDMINQAGWNENVPHKGAWFLGGEHRDHAPLSEVSPDPTGGLLLSALLGDRLDALSPPAGDRARWLQTGRVFVERRVDAVVSGKHRSAYRGAALVVAGCGEAIELAEGKGRGSTFVTGIRDRFPRHAAFRSELDRLSRSSTLLENPPRSSRRW